MGKYFSVSLVILVLALSACGKNSAPTSGKPSEQPASATPIDDADIAAREKSAPKVEETVAKIGAKLKDEPIFRACMERAAKTCSSEVINRYSTEKDSDEACSVFEDSDLRTSCANAVNAQLAKKNADPTLCSKITNASQSNCVNESTVEKAKKDRNPQVCLSLRKPKASSPSDGTELVDETDNLSDQCLSQLAGVLGTDPKAVSTCHLISREAVKTRCLNAVTSRGDVPGERGIQ